jgi:hypothetical protein
MQLSANVAREYFNRQTERRRHPSCSLTPMLLVTHSHPHQAVKTGRRGATRHMAPCWCCDLDCASEPPASQPALGLVPALTASAPPPPLLCCRPEQEVQISSFTKRKGSRRTAALPMQSFLFNLDPRRKYMWRAEFGLSRSLAHTLSAGVCESVSQFISLCVPRFPPKTRSGIIVVIAAATAAPSPLLHISLPSPAQPCSTSSAHQPQFFFILPCSGVLLL